jgi:hypothetical protein
MEESLPDGLSLERNRDLRGRGQHVWYRRVLLCAITALPILALLNVFGQKPTTNFAQTPAARLTVTAPARLRSGLIFQVKVTVAARQKIKQPQLVFSPGWWESMSENSLEPQPSNESIRDGSVVLTYNSLSAGHALTVWIYFQVNPTNVGKRREDVELDDGLTPLVTVHRSLTIFP